MSGVTFGIALEVGVLGAAGLLGGSASCVTLTDFSFLGGDSGFFSGIGIRKSKPCSAKEVITGGFALSVLMLPIVALTTEEALKLFPTNQRLASAALGANRLQTTFRVAVTTTIPAITTGILLAVARAAGETAPLLFTALFSQNWTEGLFSPTPALSVLIFNYANSPDVEQNQLAWTASVVLVSLVLCMSIVSRLVTRRRLN